MFRIIQSYLRKRNEINRFNKANALWRKLVFYSHNPEDWGILEPIILELIQQFKIPISFVTTNPKDPIRHMPPFKIAPFLIGAGRVRTHFLETIDCEQLVICNESAMKHPFPRSPHVKNYTFLFSSFQSARTIICPENLAFFDTYLCSCNHQMEELKRFAHDSGRNINILPCGATRIDRSLRIAEGLNRNVTEKTPTVFFLFSNPNLEYRDSVCDEIIRNCLDAHFRVIFRPPGAWLDRRGRFIRALHDRFVTRDLFFPDGEQASQYSIYRSDILVTDNLNMAQDLGMAFEYPTVYLQLNPRLPIEQKSLEMSLQEIMGASLNIEDLNSLVPLIERLLENRHEIARNIRALRKKELINPSRAALATAMVLRNKIQPPESVDKKMQLEMMDS